MAESRTPSSWIYVPTFALVASSATTLALVGVNLLTALVVGDGYEAGLSMVVDSPLSLVFSWAYGLMPAALTGWAATIARRGGTRLRFRTICVLVGGLTSALFCLPWGISATAAIIGAAYGGVGALAGSMFTRGIMRRVLASA